MDNDTLIDQARKLYALLINKYTFSNESNSKRNRLNDLVMTAYCRYLRRLNRCAICYQERLYDCNREAGKDHTPCLPRQACNK
ncbi:hypothetical protein [Methylomonas sp. MgM2]